MTRSKIKLQTQIFIWYSIVVCIVVVIVESVSVPYISNILIEREKQNAGSLSQIINGQLDTLYQEMAKVSSVVVYNRQVASLLDNIYDDLSVRDEMSQLKFTRDQRDLIRTLVSINGPSPTVDSINIINPEKNFFTGISAQTNPAGDVETTLSASLLEEVRQADGYYVILPPHNDFWVPGKNVKVISVMREYKDINKNSYGLVEVQQSFDRFDEICKAQLLVHNNIDIVIFDRGLNQIYLSGDTAELNETRAWLKEQVSGGTGSRQESRVHKDQFYSFSVSYTTGFYVLVVTPYREILKSVRQMQTSFFLLGSLLIVASFVFTFLLSRTIATPVRQLSAVVDKIDLDSRKISFSPISSSFFNNAETIRLNQAFENMLYRLQSSVDELAATRINEIESYLYALQAQINPHFIHNVLTNIGAIADEHELKEISGICYMLSKILRYSLSDIRSYTEMATEFENTETYLKLLQFRYGKRLHYQISLDPELKHMPIPKLILQPLVENSIIYGKTVLKDSWDISITGRINAANGWEIIIMDSGSGFNAEALEKTNALIEHLKNSKKLSAEEIYRGIGGMGIANVALRLKISFGDKIRLSAANLPNAGACITLSEKTLWPEVT